MTADKPSPFARLGLGPNPVLLAPLAGVSDSPFRRLCAQEGADLTYVEMLSATALLYESRRTYEMMTRHPAEQIVGVQLTGKTADEVGRAVEVLHRLNFETIDLNMGCPVSKVVKAGCGSAILRDPERVYETVRLATQATDKPLSVKIRLGWDRNHYSYQEVADAAERGGAAWITVHGRLRSDDYAVPVDLERIAAIKRQVRIPVIGNGNVFSAADADEMRKHTGVDGVMVSRGALGNPWVFNEIKTGDNTVTLAAWRQLILAHLDWQTTAYGGDTGAGAVCMRKHLLWYLKGWPGARAKRDELSQTTSLLAARQVIEAYADELARSGVTVRLPITHDGQGGRFVWEPKYEMDRQLDRGVGDDAMA